MAAIIFWTLYSIIVFLVLNWTIWELHKLRKSKKQDSVKELYKTSMQNIRLQDELLTQISLLYSKYPIEVVNSVKYRIMSDEIGNVIYGINKYKS